MQEVVAGMPSMAAGSTTVEVTDGTGTSSFRRVATKFEDTTTFFATAGAWEKWTFINLVPPGSPPIDHSMLMNMMDDDTPTG